MKLKLDLHPIFSQGKQIETALQEIIDEACEKRAAEIEIIPGKGSGALKKSVLRFLDRPEIKSRYHRIEKDSDNWGRLFVHFRWDKTAQKAASVIPVETLGIACFCCGTEIDIPIDRELLVENSRHSLIAECGSCGSPNRISLNITRRGDIRGTAESGYE